MKLGDTVMGLNLDHGGHLTHGSPVNASGLNYHFVPYSVNDEGFLDYDEIRRMALECRPKMIVGGASAYPRAIDFERLSEIAKEVDAILFIDMAHIAGLVAAGLHQSPVPYADVVTTTTHKSCADQEEVLSFVRKSMQKQSIRQFSLEPRVVR